MPLKRSAVLCTQSHWNLNINRTKGTVSGQSPSGPRRYLQECGSKPVHVPLQRKQGTPLPDCGWLTDIWKRTGHPELERLYPQRLVETRALVLCFVLQTLISSAMPHVLRSLKPPKHHLTTVHADLLQAYSGTLGMKVFTLKRGKMACLEQRGGDGTNTVNMHTHWAATLISFTEASGLNKITF